MIYEFKKFTTRPKAGRKGARRREKAEKPGLCVPLRAFVVNFLFPVVTLILGFSVSSLPGGLKTPGFERFLKAGVLGKHLLFGIFGGMPIGDCIKIKNGVYIY
jgi:hypothetical protein